jgi:hypothetical protein
VFGGAVGLTVRGMPQIGQLRKGLWVASGRPQGMNTSAMAGQLIARSILWGDERWRLFSPFELVWAGGATSVAGHFIGLGTAGPLPRRARWRVTGRRARQDRIRSWLAKPPPGRHPAAAAAPSGPPGSPHGAAAVAGAAPAHDGPRPRRK